MNTNTDMVDNNQDILSASITEGTEIAESVYNKHYKLADVPLEENVLVLIESDGHIHSAYGNEFKKFTQDCNDLKNQEGHNSKNKGLYDTGFYKSLLDVFGNNRNKELAVNAKSSCPREVINLRQIQDDPEKLEEFVAKPMGIK